MIFSLSVLVVTSLAYQAGPPQTANGFRRSVPPELNQPKEPAKALTPEVRGDILMARKMYREAAEMYRTCPPDSAVAANKTGIAYHQLLEIDQAKKWYERAVKLNSQYSEAINNLGTIYYSQKSYRRAITQYRKSLRIQPENAAVLSNLGTAYFARKNYQEAFQMYQQALQLDPEVFEHRNTHGVLLQERTVDEKAKFHYYLAKTYAKAGMNDRAILYIRKALEEGFKEREKFNQEPEFAAVRAEPEFKQLMAQEQKVL
jgi:tetratricopeptide (TPR) repeat protein